MHATKENIFDRISAFVHSFARSLSFVNTTLPLSLQSFSVSFSARSFLFYNRNVDLHTVRSAADATNTPRR